MRENELISLVKAFAKEIGKTPTLASFSKHHNIKSSSIIARFGSWNSILTKAGLVLNKANKRTSDQLILWLKIHPNAKYKDIPFGIRNGIEEKFGSLSKAREKAGLKITDWRASAKRSHRVISDKVGRPIEYTKAIIIEGLQQLATKLGRPPRMKDITKSKCGFPITAVLSRFGSFNDALQAAFLPPVYSHYEFKKLAKELDGILINIKLQTKDIPKYYNLDINGEHFTFVYDNLAEYVVLKRSDITADLISILKEKINDKKLKIYYLVDDSLFEDKEITIKCLMDYANNIDKVISDKILEVRLRYDEINRKYIFNKDLFKTAKNEEDNYKPFEEKGSSQ